MAYKYTDFLEKAQAEGLYDQFGEMDLEKAKENPTYGMGILSGKIMYRDAKTPEAKQQARTWTENYRQSVGGYSTDPTGQYFMPNMLSPSSFEQQDPYGDKIGQLLQKLYERKPFQYDVKSDPQYQTFLKEAMREGRRAMEDTMGSYAAMTGGVPSTAAVTAASQANNYYNAQLADALPKFYQQAYDRYMQEFQTQAETAGLMRQQQAADYGRLTDEVTNQRIRRDEESQARQEAFQKALTAYQMGDARMLEELGIDTSKDVNRQLQELQLRSYEWQDQLQRAQAAAQIGDYSLLQAMGFDTTQAEFEKDLTLAQIAAAYGDYSLMRDLLNSRGANILAGAAPAGSGGSSGGYTGGPAADPGDRLVGNGLTEKQNIAAARVRQYGTGTSADGYPGAYPSSGLSEADMEAILAYNAANHSTGSAQPEQQSTGSRSDRYNRGRR